MRFDTESIHSCLTSSGCAQGTADGGGSGGVTDPRCADATFCLANPSICGTQCGSESPCSDPNYRATHLTECEDDPRCADPVFAAANPALCLDVPTLILKPEYVSREAGKSVQYIAVLLLGGEEVELSSGVAFSSGDTSIAVIASTAGNATGLSAGIVTIVAQYGSLYAYAQLEIISSGECAGRPNFFELVIDHSKSMGGAFSGMTPTRLTFAKKMSAPFAASVDLTKDLIGLMSFDASVSSLLGFIADPVDLPLLNAAIGGIAVNTAGRTNIAAALLAAKALINDQAPAPNSVRAIVLFSDGENNEGEDPIAVASAIKAEGFIIFVVGLRAKGNAFLMLDRIATGGFFINALPSNESSVFGWLSGLKGYMCSGNCEPEGGVSVGVGSLNFSDFQHWTVTEGHVDLIGQNVGGPELYNFLPGNGAYVDLCGSTPGVNDLGKMQSELFDTTAAVLYNVNLRLAGNQREDKTGTVLVEAYDDTDTLIDSQSFVIDPFDDFTVHTFQFTATTAQSYIVVSQSAIEAGATGVFGSLFDGVTITPESDESEIIFEDDFDDDNVQEIPPCTGGELVIGYGGFGYGYSCPSYGCLTSAIPAQTPDSSPLADLELS